MSSPLSSPRTSLLRVQHLAACVACSLIAISCAGSGARDPGPSAPIVEVVTEQEILTPLPLRVRLPVSYNAEHVIVLFRTWGSRGWSQLELARAGQTWSGEVSCRHVSTVTGDTRYFFVALDENGELVGGSGSPDWPHVATVIGQLPGGARALPQGSLPLRCHDPADCPPDFPGCPAYAYDRASCRSDRDCKKGGEYCAWDGYCGAPSGELPTTIEGVGATEEEQLASAVRVLRQRYKRSASGSGSSSHVYR